MREYPGKEITSEIEMGIETAFVEKDWYMVHALPQHSRIKSKGSYLYDSDSRKVRI